MVHVLFDFHLASWHRLVLFVFGLDRSRSLGVSSGTSGSFIFRLFYQPLGRIAGPAAPQTPCAPPNPLDRHSPTNGPITFAENWWDTQLPASMLANLLDPGATGVNGDGDVDMNPLTQRPEHSTLELNSQIEEGDVVMDLSLHH